MTSYLRGKTCTKMDLFPPREEKSDYDDAVSFQEIREQIVHTGNYNGRYF